MKNWYSKVFKEKSIRYTNAFTGVLSGDLKE